MIFKLKILLFISLISLSAKAQLSSKTFHDQFADSIKLYYNAKNYKAIYNLLSPTLQKQITDQQFTSYFTIHFNKYYSLIKTNYLDKDKSNFFYNSFFEKDTLKLILRVNLLKQIEEMEFKPLREKISTKNLNYKSDNKKQTTLDSLIDNMVEVYMQNPQNCGLSIGIIKDGKTLFYNYGETKKGNAQLPNNKTVFEIGSITKTFCGNLLAIAVTEKKINLDDDIRTYLPQPLKNLELNSKPILIKHLANHTSGLTRLPDDFEKQIDYDILNPYKNYTKQLLYTYLKVTLLSSEPGTVCEYSNLGMALLGLILEDVYKKTFEELVNEKICNPYKLSDTKINLLPTQLNNFANGHNDLGETTPHWDFASFYAAGALKSNTNDMLNFLNYNLTELDEATKLAHLTTFNNGTTIALAWQKMQRKNTKELVWHNGATGGFTSFCGYIKENNCGFVILSNSINRCDFIGLALYNYLQK